MASKVKAIGLLMTEPPTPGQLAKETGESADILTPFQRFESFFLLKSGNRIEMGGILARKNIAKGTRNASQCIFWRLFHEPKMADVCHIHNFIFRRIILT